MKDYHKLVANNIRKLREIKGYTQEKLAEEVDISVSHLSKAETGQRQLSMNTYINILQELDATFMLITYLKGIEGAEEFMQEFITLINDCSKDEMQFLLKTMISIKQNLKIVS